MKGEQGYILCGWKKNLLCKLWFSYVSYIGSKVVGTITIVRQQNDWVGGFGKWPVWHLVLYLCCHGGRVGGSEKVHKYSDVI